MLLVITSFEFDDKTHRRELRSDFIQDTDTNRRFVCPGDHPRALGAVFNEQLGEWVLPALAH